MQIGSEATGGGDYVAFFFSQYLISFANKMGSKINKHVGVSTRGVYDPLAGVTTRTRRVRVVHPPEYLPRCVSYINIYIYMYIIVINVNVV